MAACDPATDTHQDAVVLVEYLMDRHGSCTEPQDVIARQLGMVIDNGGMLNIDRGRFHRARQHLHDRVDSNGRPCCGFRLHYRKSGRGGSTLALIDPSGDLGDATKAAMATVGGFTSRKRQHDTEDRRMLETFRAVADNCLAQGDLDGARAMLMARIDIERHGAVTPQTMAELETYMATS